MFCKCVDCVIFLAQNEGLILSSSPKNPGKSFSQPGKIIPKPGTSGNLGLGLRLQASQAENLARKPRERSKALEMWDMGDTRPGKHTKQLLNMAHL